MSFMGFIKELVGGFSNQSLVCRAMWFCMMQLDIYKSNNRMLNAAARQMMRAEARTRIAQEFRKYKQSEDWDNYCTILYDKYSDPWSYN